jgi:uncharacterized protein (DUF302 family)
MAITDNKWLRRSPYSVKETAERLFQKLAEHASVMIIAHVEQNMIAEMAGKSIKDIECLMFQNRALVGKILSTNIEAGFELPIKALIWEDNAGQVWLRCTNIDRLNEEYDLQGAEGAIDAIYTLLPAWLDHSVS